MSPELISILVLVGVFLIATVLPVQMGALAIVAAMVVGALVANEEIPDEVLAGFPADLFLILVGVTYLFAIARDNGTIDWLVQAAVRAVRGRVALIPWVMFLVTALLTSVGAVVPAAVAIIAPVGLSFAVRHHINPLLMGLLIINGASAGGFSPISIFGSITNGVVDRSGLPGSPALLFLASFVVNFLLSVVVFFLFGGRDLLHRRAPGHEDVGAQVREEERIQHLSGSGAGVTTATRPATASGVAATVGSGQPGALEGRDAGAGAPGQPEQQLSLDPLRALTLVGIALLAVGAFVFDIDVGVVAITIGVLLSLASTKATNKAAVAHIAWPTVLLVCGIVTYVSLMERIGTIDWLGEQVAGIGAPLLAALLICFIGAAVSAFASTTGILGALIPLAVPFLLAGEVGAIGMIIALALSSSIVDSSPFSTSGALVVANSPEENRDFVYRRLLQWGFSMIVIAPVVTWLMFVVPGWG